MLDLYCRYLVKSFGTNGADLLHQ